MSIGRSSPIVSFGIAGFVPLLVSLFMALLMLLPIGSGVANEIMPNLVLISVFYWLSNRPLLMPYGACAVLGLFMDLWLDVPLGLNMLILVLTRLFVLNQLKHYRGRSRFVHWLVFALMSLAMYVLSWIVISGVETTLWPVRPLLLQWLVTAFSYAPVGFVLGRLRRTALR
ncbi:MAG: rod shape-determining protein MreD [Alphaproteobacteria bacterium]|nr:MAG: rod shape-determining protein MreD [Alphaproteobacteria bacterium]